MNHNDFLEDLQRPYLPLDSKPLKPVQKKPALLFVGEIREGCIRTQMLRGELVASAEIQGNR